VVSNSLQIVVKPLPQDLDLVGDFNLSVNVDKRKTKPNEPVNVTIAIEGEGNIESFEGVKLNISNATVYEDKPKKEVVVRDGKIFSKFVQHFSIIADRDFTIPAIDIDYFSLKEKKIKRLHNDPVKIHVIGAHLAASSAPKRSESNESGPQGVQKKKDSFWIGFSAGVASTLFVLAVAGGFWWLRGKKFKLKFGDKRQLLAKLFPYVAESKEAAAMAQALYEEIYEGKRSRVSKKEVERLLKDLMQSRSSLHPRA
jgi:hypothetical protein